MLLFHEILLPNRLISLALIIARFNTVRSYSGVIFFNFSDVTYNTTMLGQSPHQLKGWSRIARPLPILPALWLVKGLAFQTTNRVQFSAENLLREE